MIILVAAMSRGRVIGLGGRLPWSHGRMNHDQNRFRRLVHGQDIAIGSGTFDPDDDYVRNAGHIYLLTTKDMEDTDKLTVCHSIQPVLNAARSRDVYVVGGAGVYEEFVPHAGKLELTYIDADYQGDRFFPEFDEGAWQTVRQETHPANEDDIHPYKFVTLIKK